ncbi:MAG: SRPBCC family protein [Acidobacteriia bacterium]|nr:SRPBCC family protein [Terriglobia bacterium]
MVSSSVTKKISINAPVSKVFTFVANLANWPQWAIANVVAVKPGSDEWWALETCTGLGRLRIKPDEASGTLDYDISVSGVKWTVAARVVADGAGSEFSVTYSQPPSLSKDAFDKQISLVDKELAKLKELMES